MKKILKYLLKKRPHYLILFILSFILEIVLMKQYEWLLEDNGVTPVIIVLMIMGGFCIGMLFLLISEYRLMKDKL